MEHDTPDEATRIRTVLKENPLGLSIKEVAAKVGMSRNSVAKYLEVMTATGQLELRHVGNAKLYTLSQRVPVTNIINYAKELIIVLDRSLQIVEASDSFCAFAGVPREAVLHTRLSAPPASLLTPSEESTLSSLLNGGSVWKKEIRLIRGASEIYLDGRFIPTALQNGEPGITLILEDISERRRAERAMQERDRLLHTIFQIPTLPRFFIDQNHKVVYWDRALEIMTGIKSEEVIGTNQHWKVFYATERPCLADLLVDGDTARLKAAYPGIIHRTGAGDGEYECTEFFPGKQGSGKWLRITVSVIRDSAGHVTGVMETLEDVTDQKNREFVIEP
ncbi:MAG: PAS domain S-box protein [Methanomicrobiales archaeon]|nr:PAS domain S-box protein [Methanomicrobiales archaeon]